MSAPNSSVAPSRRKQTILGVSLSLISICLVLFLLELGVRLLPPPYDADTGQLFTCQPALGWTGRPNFAGEFQNDLFQQTLHFNRLGMHDAEHSLTKPPDTFRILMLGDSFVHAVQVDEAATAHQLLEDQLNQAEPPTGDKVEVISAGVTNWGTNQQLIFYREQGRQFSPDVVLLMVYLGNDLLDNLPGNVLTIDGVNCYAPYFAVCGDVLNPDPLPYAPGLNDLPHDCAAGKRGLITAMGWLYQHSRLYQQIEPLIVATKPRRQFGQDYDSPFSALYLPNDEVELEEAWQVTLATIAQLRDEVEADGSRFAVALISPEIVVRLATLSPAEQQLFLRDNPTFVEAQADRPNVRLAQFFNDQAIPFLDLTLPMVEHLRAGSPPLYITGEWHWTVEGNRVAAEALAEWFQQNQLITSQ
ncbi:MAG: hypothetical protein H6631_14330 [Anaerolineaceae bacterium]|nr:hypothetical protein [Anaerolineaceae bacterium]